jgi:hypothetical protein
MDREPNVPKVGLLDMQVCVPSEWTDKQALEFAEGENPCGTQHGWSIRREGSEHLSGSPERVDCCELEGFVHIMIDA